MCGAARDLPTMCHNESQRAVELEIHFVSRFGISGNTVSIGARQACTDYSASKASPLGVRCTADNVEVPMRLGGTVGVAGRTNCQGSSEAQANRREPWHAQDKFFTKREKIMTWRAPQACG